MSIVKKTAAAASVAKSGIRAVNVVVPTPLRTKTATLGGLAGESQKRKAAAAAAASASDEEDGDGDEDELVIVKKPRRDEAYGSDSDSSSCAPSPLLTAKRLEVFLPVVLEPVAAAAAAAEAAARVRAAAARARAAEEAAQARAAAEAEEVKKSTETTLEGLVGEAKAAFARTPASLVVAGRDKERAVIERFLEERVVQEQSGGALYISGCPGAGKTLLVSTLVQETVKSTPLRVAQINCMSMKNVRTIYSLLLAELGYCADEEEEEESESGSDDGKEEDAMETTAPRARISVADRVQRFLVDPATPLCLVLLDEIDYLVSRDQEILYHIFEIAAMPSSRLILVGIANALDLTDRLLPRLRAKNVVPQLLNFAPYTHPELASVLRNRLTLLPNRERILFDDDAIQLCARKVAATSGDTRKALDICRLAMDAALKKLQQRKAKAEAAGMPFDDKSPLKVTLIDVSSVLSLVFGSPYVEKMRQLQIHAKVSLHAAMVCQSKLSESSCITRIYELYSGICRQKKLVSPVSKTEFVDLCSMLESAGLVSIKVRKGERDRYLSLNVQVDDINYAFKGDTVFHNIVGK